MTRPHIATVATAALASSAAFYVITRSGLAGTLVGAAVASMVYTGTSHWVGSGLERCTGWWRERTVGSPGDPGLAGGAAETGEVEPRSGADTSTLSATSALEAAAGREVADFPAPPPWRRLPARWAALALAAAALGTSAYSVVSGTPIERVIVRERVVEKPVIQERVVIQKETVTVTVPAKTPSKGPTGDETPAAPTTTSTETPTTSTTTTTEPGSTSTTSTEPPSTTTVPPTTSGTTLAPPPGG